jgi:hypothetical protein
VKPDKKKKGTSGGINVLARKDDSVVRWRAQAAERAKNQRG